MKKFPLVSVIVPIYNSEAFLRRCLDSIVGQTYQNLEIILVNDGSTDNSAKIITEYQNKDKRIKVITQKNQGLSVARNAGLKKMSGDYLTFIDADDYVARDMVEYLLSAKNADIAVCSHFEVFENGTEVKFGRQTEIRTMNQKTALKNMLNEQGFMVSAWGKLYKKSVFKNLEFPVGKLHEDVGTTYLAFLNAETIVFLPQPKYYYFQRQNSLSKDGFNQKRMDLIKLTDEMCDEIDKKYPELENTTKRRRMRARMAILRQTDKSQPENQAVFKYLKNHQDYIFKNPEASKAEVLTLGLALFNQNLLKMFYKTYKNFRKNR